MNTPITYEALMKLRDEMNEKSAKFIRLEVKWEVLASASGRARLSAWLDANGRPIFVPEITGNKRGYLMGMRVFDRPALPGNVIILKPIASDKIDDCIFYVIGEDES